MIDSQNKKIVLSGGCFCAKVRYEVSDEILKSGICHCHACQRLTGGTSWPFIVVTNQSLSISGDLKEFTRNGASGKKVHLGFCPNCGSTLFGRPEAWPQIRTVSASSLDNPEYFAPNMHVWTEDAQDWILFTPDLPQFTQNPTGEKS